MNNPERLNLLLVEDSPTDVLLIREALGQGKITTALEVVASGGEAMEFLRRQGRYQAAFRPDLILLDLNMPQKGGLEVLAEIKAEEALRTIPVVILTTSKAETDVSEAYALQANCYLTKKVDFDEFSEVLRTIEHFWGTVVTLPPT